MDNTTSNMLFSGVVTKVDPVSYIIEVAPLQVIPGEGLMKGIAVVPFFAKFFGFRESALPEPDSHVICCRINAQECVVLGSIVTRDEVNQGMPWRTVAKATDGSFDAQNVQKQDTLLKMYYHNNNRPTDVVEGERVIANDFGVMLQLLQQFASLKASDLAQVQVHLLDDLVRVVSHNFQHFTGMGETRLTHDGNTLHLEYGATHIPAEALGRPSVDGSTVDPVFKTNTSVPISTSDDEKDCVDFASKDEEKIAAVERLKLFVGTLGDFVNLFITAPTKGNKYVMNGTAPDNPDHGLLQVKASVDGGLYVRSAKEVFIEKTNWIRVPQRVFLADDVEGDDGTTITPSVKTQFSFDQTFKQSGIPDYYSLQLRDYAVYIQEYVNYLNYQSFPKDISLPSGLPANKIDAVKQVDPSTPTTYFPSQAGIYWMQNGGLMLKDAWGDALILEAGRVYIQAAKDVVLQPARHLLGKVGGVLNMEVNGDIDLVSATKGIRMKSELSNYIYSRSGGVVLHSDSADQTAAPSEDTALESIGGVVLKSKTNIYSLAVSNNILSSNTSFIKGVIVDVEGTAQINAIGSDDGATVNIVSKNSVNISSQNSTNISSVGAASLYGLTSTLVAVQEQTFARVPFDDGYLPVEGVVDPAQVDGTINQVVSDGLAIDRQSDLPIFSDAAEIDALKFRYLGSTDYGSTDGIPMTISQQQDSVFQTYQYSEWQSGYDPVINGTLPYPGADLYDTAYITNPVLNNLQQFDGNLYAKTSDLASSTILSTTSLKQYKVFSK